MDIKGTLNEDELVKYISIQLKLETIKIITASDDLSNEDKIKFISTYLKEV